MTNLRQGSIGTVLLAEAIGAFEEAGAHHEFVEGLRDMLAAARGTIRETRNKRLSTETLEEWAVLAEAMA